MHNTENVLLDPSLLLASNSMINTFEYLSKIAKLGGEYQFYLPVSFRRLLKEPELTTDSPAIRFFLYNATPSDLRQLYILVNRHSDILLSFEPAEVAKDIHSQMYEMLHKELYFRGELLDERLLDILFEEWFFMQKYSWVVSRIKKPFNRFLSAGAVCIQFGQNTLDRLVRRTLRSDPDYYLSNVDRLRVLGKWIAVGLGAKLLAEYVSTWAAGLPGFFMLFDPEHRVHSGEQ